MPTKIHERRFLIRRLTFSAVMTALSVLLLFLGGFMEMLDISMAALAGIIMLMAVIENVTGWTVAEYVGTCILALTLMPFNFAGWSFLLLFGYYPILKKQIEQRIHLRPVRILVKQLICVLAGLAMLAILILLLQTEDIYGWIAWAMGGLYLLVFWIYDLLLSQIQRIYIFKFQPKLKVNLK